MPDLGKPYRVGDAVFGQATGCLGSAVLCNARTVVAMPPGLTFAEAATVPTAFLTAYDCLRATACIGSDSRVLVHAATGAQTFESVLPLTELLISKIMRSVRQRSYPTRQLCQALTWI